MVRPPCLISVLPCKAILVTRAAALKVGMGSVVPVDMDWIPRSIYKDVWFICDYPSADNYLIYLVLRWQRFDRVAMALENSHIAGEPGRKQLVTQAWENVFFLHRAFQMHLKYKYIWNVCVYMCLLHMESTRDLGYHCFGTYPDIPSNLWNKKVLLSSSRLFFSTYISSRVMLRCTVRCRLCWRMHKGSFLSFYT